MWMRMQHGHLSWKITTNREQIIKYRTKHCRQSHRCANAIQKNNKLTINLDFRCIFCALAACTFHLARFLHKQQHRELRFMLNRRHFDTMLLVIVVGGGVSAHKPLDSGCHMKLARFCDSRIQSVLRIWPRYFLLGLLDFEITRLAFYLFACSLSFIHHLSNIWELCSTDYGIRMHYSCRAIFFAVLIVVENTFWALI